MAESANFVYNIESLSLMKNKFNYCDILRKLSQNVKNNWTIAHFRNQIL